MCLALLLAPFLAGESASALVASASALAVLAAARYCCKVILLVGSADATGQACAIRSLARAVRILPQCDPDAAGKPRPRAPGLTPSTV